METFSTIVNEVQYTLMPMGDGRYSVLDGDNRMGYIYPKRELIEGVGWESDEDIAPALVDKLGEFIDFYKI